MDSVSESRLSQVHPDLGAKIRIMNQTVPIRVTQGFRSYTEQDALYQQGRSLPGKVVTNARPGESWHNFGLAVDVVPMTELGPDWNKSHPVWLELLRLGESLGLVEGATWRSFPDWPHFQWTGTFPVSPDAEVRDTFDKGGITEVWRQAFPEVSA